MKDINAYKDMVAKCVRCGFCQAHCPTYKALGAEPFVARGRLEMVNATFDGRLDGYVDGVMKRMNQCLLCGNCTQNCPPGIETEKIVEAYRTAYIKEKGIPDVLSSVKTFIADVGNITGDAPDNRMLWVNNIQDKLGDVKINEPAEYAYFVGCVPSLYPSAYSIPQNFAAILKAANVSFSLLGKEEKCCGYPLAVGGLPEEAKKTAESNIQKLKQLGIKKVVTGCPSCYHMWKDYYPELLGYDPGVEVFHSTQLMAQLISEGALKFRETPMEVTYHDPCDLGRKSGIFDPPREILQNIPGVVLKEMAYNRLDSRCCGGGGNLEMNDAALSSKVAQDRISQAQNTGAKVIVSACQQCKRTLQAGARAMKARIKVKDICEIVFDALAQD